MFKIIKKKTATKGQSVQDEPTGHCNSLGNDINKMFIFITLDADWSLFTPHS